MANLQQGVASTRLMRVAVTGDSLCVGAWSSIPRSSSASTKWIGKFATKLQQLYGDGGSGVASISQDRQWPGYSGYTDAVTNVAHNGTWSYGATGFGTMNNQYIYSTLVGSAIWFYTRGSTLTLMYTLGLGFGTFQVYIDNVLVDTVNTTNIANLSTQKLYTTTNAEHTLTVVVTDTTNGNVIIEGAAGANPTGVVVDLYCTGGALLSQFVYGYRENPLTLSGAGAGRAADLVINEFGLVDANSNTALSVFSQSVSTLLAAFPTTEVIQVSPAYGLFGSYISVYQQYIAYLATVMNGGSVLDIGATLLQNNNYTYGTSIGYWGSSSLLGPAGSDPVHPGDKGHCMMYHALMQYVRMESNATTPLSQCP